MSLRQGFKVTEAIQALSPTNQDIFVRLFYYKMKLILSCHAKPMEKRYRSYRYSGGLPLSLFDYIFCKFNYYSLEEELNLIDRINSIPSPNQYALDSDEIRFFQNIEKLISKVPSFYKANLGSSMKEEKIFIQLLLDIYNTYFIQKPIADYPRKLETKYLQQLAELNDLYKNPHKYLKEYLAPPQMLHRFFNESKDLHKEKKPAPSRHSAAASAAVITMTAAAAAR